MEISGTPSIIFFFNQYRSRPMKQELQLHVGYIRNYATHIFSTLKSYVNLKLLFPKKFKYPKGKWSRKSWRINNNKSKLMLNEKNQR